ncbi:MAG: response regulator transcription factor [Thermincola sp.]|jgi:DNA-binding response OmpR family regulator|nr:response regulator transcription factor [Thermincola sp.]MDT3704113.1 response regulator transcription factor [Thermincola sp.]
MSGEKILVVDDDPDISEVINLYLTKNGFEVFSADDGQKAVDTACLLKPDLIILDIQMPKLDGFEVCQEIRKESNVPILFLSCKGEETDKIVGLTIGGDDYITKPFMAGELLARVKSHLRRSRTVGTQKKPETGAITFPGISIDPASHSVLVNGQLVALPAKEFQLLATLAKRPNVIFGIEQLFQSLWGADSLGDNRTVMVHISNLRKKIETDPANPKYIHTVKGVGYKFSPPAASE